MSQMTVSDGGRFLLTYTVNGATDPELGLVIASLSTQNKFVDKDIDIKLFVPSASTSVSGKTVSYSSGWIATGSQSVALGTITSGAAAATISDPVYNSSTSKFDLTASGNVAAPTVSVDGYVSSSEGTKNSNTGGISGSKSLNKIKVGVTVNSNNITVTPTIARTAKPSGDTWTDAASGAVTTTKPSSGVYVQVDAAAVAGSTTVTGKVSTAGYGTTSQYSTDSATTITGGSNAATSAYVPIKSASGYSLSVTSISGSSDVTVGTKDANNKYPLTANNISVTGTFSASTNGWFSSSSATDSDTDNVVIGKMAEAAITGTATNATATTTVAPGTVSIAKDTTAVSGKTRLDYSVGTGTTEISTYYIAVKATAAANSTGTTSAITGTVNASVTTAGYAPTSLTGTGSVSGTATAKTSSKSSSVYYIPVPTAGFTVSNDKIYCSTAGYVPTGSASSPIGTVSGGSISVSNTDPGASYTANTTAVVPSGGYLVISAGYYEATKISLATLVPNEASLIASTGADYILQGSTAYDKNGALITGTIGTYDGTYTVAS